MSVFPFPWVRIKKAPAGLPVGAFSSPVAAWVFCRAAFLVIRSMKMLWAAPALAKIKAITKPPKKHSSDRSHRLGAESLQNIQLTGRVCGLHAFQYIPPVFNLATHEPEFFSVPAKKVGSNQ
ncbi:hypothetical protein [Marinobacter sp. F3R08]|uniref:hypothetical protein n=1 Tax=Marinobacter sp. F3R08 TaxID=2841559 RepID=UPI001C082EE9|nr:hypothetical protein [Marinobacter sp. F3R08]MBU2953301.1 hypothetical protein [Marinobacter sp. F3R08]